MIKKWFEIILDHRISMRERMFRIVTLVCMIALVFTLPMGRRLLNIAILLASLLAMAAIVKISIRKGRVEAGATAIVVLMLALFPFTFFSAGGFYSGVPEWFVLCFIYVCITLHGKRMAVFFGLCTAETLLCYGIALYYPDIAAINSQQRSFFDSAFSMIMVGMLISVLLMFLNRMYEEENALSQQQKKENIPYIFDAFQRVDEEKNRHIEGTGLGLSIVRQLVKLMGGEISVNSVYTKGSKFIVSLEQDIVDDKELGTFTLATRTRAKSDGPYRQSFEAPDAHILVVDDNDMNLMVVTKLLAETKIQIDTASSGAECLRLTQIHHYDCILMDHMMPEMDGIECLHALREQPGGLCQDVPVVALTANAGSDNQLLYKKEGFSGYLAKPVGGALLEAAVLSVLPKKLVSLCEEAGQPNLEKDVLIFEQVKRRFILITTDSVCDLPETLLKELDVSVCPYYVHTEAGRFLDGLELQPDELLAHMAQGRKGESRPPEVEDYERFFAEKLTEAQNVIHISMAKHVSAGYQNALEAAKSFNNVTVVDSGHLSSGMGLSVLWAAQLAENHAGKAEIVAAVERAERFISSAFIINSTHMLCQAGRISKRIQVLCDALLLHPILVLRKSKMVVGSMEVGDFSRIAKKYVRKVLQETKSIDRRVLFITYAGLDEKKLQYIQNLVRQHCAFERVYLQKASSAIASNCGSGSFGLMFMRKDEASGSGGTD